MQHYLLILLSVVLCVCQDTTPELPNPEEECVRKLLLHADHLDDIMVHYVPGKLPENDEEFIKYTGCRAQQEGAQDESGSINFDNLQASLKHFNRRIYSKQIGTIGEELASKAVENCKNISQETDNGKSFIKLQNCIDKYLINYFNTTN